MPIKAAWRIISKTIEATSAIITHSQRLPDINSIKQYKLSRGECYKRATECNRHTCRPEFEERTSPVVVQDGKSSTETLKILKLLSDYRAHYKSEH